MIQQEIDDAELIEACRHGKTEAFEVIIRRYQSSVCALTYSAVGNAATSEELAQEVFILAWRNLSQLRDRAKFKGWLFQIARNQVRRFFRENKRNVLSGASTLADAHSAGSFREEPVRQAISRETQQAVWQALSRIPVHYREPLVLYYREGKSIRQVARLFDVTEVTAKKRISRARAMVRSVIESDMERAISRTCPKKHFCSSVMAVIAGGAVLGAGSTAGAASSAVFAEGGGWVSAWLGGATAKTAAIVLTLAVVAATGTFIVRQQGGTGEAGSISILPAALDDGLIMYLSFDLTQEGLGQTIIVDESYNGNDGILQGGKLVEGRIGRALQCRANKKTDGVIVPDQPSLNPSTVTITAWIRTSRQDGQWNRIVDKGWQSAYNLCIGGVHNEKTWMDRLWLEIAGSSVCSQTLVTDGNWHFVAGSFDGRTLRVYVDGRLDQMMSLEKRAYMNSSGVDLRIGQLAVPEAPPYDEAFFDGLIDEVRLYRRVLSDEEILTISRYLPSN